MKKSYQIVAMVLFLLTLFSVPICILVTKDVEFSESENRYLAGRPSFSLANIQSGKFMEESETYMNDQFPQKDFWISFRSDFLRLMGNKEINGVYLAKDDYLIEKWITGEFDQKQLAENVDSLNDFAQRHPGQNISMILVPTAGMILEDKLPPNAPIFDQKIAFHSVIRRLQGISYIDLNLLFASHGTEALYYKTDHHWTSYGASLAYSAWCDVKGKSADLEKFEVKTATESFQGSLYSKVLGTHCAEDKIDLYIRKDEGAYYVEYNSGKIQSDTVFAMDRITQKDKYQVFLGGNYPEITIKTSQKNGKRLLLIKDSFANAFVPFLLNDYEMIHIIDPRYFKGSVDDYILKNRINDYLFLYNIKNFCEDENLKNILME